MSQKTVGRAAKEATEKKSTLNLKTPNSETREAIEELKDGRGLKSKNADDLFKDLGIK